MQNIIAAVDFSEVAESVLSRSAEIAKGLACQLWLVHVAAPEPDFVGYEAGPQSVRDQVAKHLKDEHLQLQESAQSLRDQGIEATALLIQGPTVATILREAEKLNADLIVLGSHGHGQVLRSLLGSVSEGVLHKAKTPVLIVPAHSR